MGVGLTQMLLCAVCCFQGSPDASRDRSSVPLCVVEQTQETLGDRKGKLTPAPIDHMLLIPCFCGERGEVFVACPSIQHQGQPTVVSKDRWPKNARLFCRVILCPGYLPSTLRPIECSRIDTIDGKKHRVVQLAKASSKREALRILEDWEALFQKKSFSVARAHYSSYETPPEDYATCSKIHRSVGNNRVSYYVWQSVAFANISIKLSDKDKAVVADFLREEKRKLLSEDPMDRTGDVLARIDQLASTGERVAPTAAMEALAKDIEEDRARVLRVMLDKLEEKRLTDPQKAVYAWALGLTKDANAISPLIKLHRQSKSPAVKRDCISSLTAIGGDEAGRFLLDVLDSTTEREARFELLNFLAQMQYEPALPKMEEVLREGWWGAHSGSWHAAMVFGKMGDKGVPFLLKKINDDNTCVRGNAIAVLGEWLLAQEAVEPMKKRLRVETDQRTRANLIRGVMMTLGDLDRIIAFGEEFRTFGMRGELVSAAKRCFRDFNPTPYRVDVDGKAEKGAKEAFQREYAVLFKSAGRKGDYGALAIDSTVEDEAKLRALRERILQRNSGESLHDYQKVNRVIRFNRMVATLSETGDARMADPLRSERQKALFVESRYTGQATVRTGKVLSAIQRIEIDKKGEVDLSTLEKLAEDIEKEPANMAKTILYVLDNGSPSESALVASAWVLGVTKEPIAVKGLIHLYGHTPSVLVKQQCVASLANIGGNEAGEFLKTLDFATKKGGKTSSRPVE